MDFQTAVKTVIQKNYANFSGRAGRPEFWWFTLFMFLTNLVLQFLDRHLPLFGLIAFVISLGLLIPALAVLVRRLHDAGKSGLWALIGLIPLIGTIVLIYFCVQPGEPGPNRYGAPAA